MRLHLLKCLQDGKTVPQRIRNYPSQSQGYHYRQAQPVLPLPHALETIWQRSSWNGNGWMRDMFKVVSSKMRNHPWQHVAPGLVTTAQPAAEQQWHFILTAQRRLLLTAACRWHLLKCIWISFLGFFLHKVVSLVRFCFFVVFSLEEHKIPNE